MADEKVTDLSQELAPAATDIAYMVDDPSGAPVSKKVTLGDFVEGGFPNHGVRVYRTEDQTVAEGDDVDFTAERWDTDAYHDIITNPERLTCQLAGVYFIQAQVNWESSGGGSTRQLSLLLNGVTTLARIRIVAGETYEFVSTVYVLSVSDYVTASVYQNTGGDLDILAGGNYTPEFMMQWLGPV